MLLANLEDSERRVYSQNGSDGVIEAIFAAIGVTDRYFVEFGIGFATQCNTAHLLERGWTGLMMDGGGISHNPLATVQKEFITRENINALFAKYDVPREFDFLSMDMDGNDYWVWQALAYRPRVVAIEYNASVPPELRLTIPYDPGFQWDKASDFFGAGIRALAELGDSKGYQLVYCDRAGADAFFIARSALPSGYVPRSLAEIYRPPNYYYQGLAHAPEPCRAMIDPAMPDGERITLSAARKTLVAQIFQVAAEHHSHGDLEHAEKKYKRILAMERTHADARANLGIVLHDRAQAAVHSRLRAETQCIGRTQEASASFAETIGPSPELFKMAVQNHQSGNLAQAEPLYRQILQTHPEHAGAHHMLGLISYQTGHPEAALDLIRKALDLDPATQGAHFNLGIVLLGQGHFAEAASCFQHTLRLDPRHVEGHINLGNALLKQGRYAEAGKCYRQALALAPLHADARINLGHALMDQALVTEATASFREALCINPRHVHGYYALGKVLLSQGRLDEAGFCFRQVLRLDPANPKAHFNLGNVFKEQKNLSEACACYRQALRIDPNCADFYIHLGNAHGDQGQFEEAIACNRQALRLNPLKPHAHYNLGIALGELGRLDEAIQAYRQEVRINPNHLEAQGNLAAAHMRLGQLRESEQHNDEALRIDPTNGKALFRRATLRLSQGDFSGGWPDYEQRWLVLNTRSPRLPGPRWDGSALNGKTILVYHEQGLGDTIQFLRYLPMVKMRGGTVLFKSQTALEKLLTGIPGVDQFVPAGGPFPPYDVQAPLLSLPGLLRTTLATIPANGPYLHADPELVSWWGKELQSLAGFKIGIVWQANPLFGDDRFRSIPLETFGQLAQIPGVNLVSLQKGPGTEQLPAFQKRFPILDLNHRLHTFNDTAAVMMNLNLIIGCCTSVPHLAGALGLPVWTVLQLNSDWRWLIGREDSPWYPTMRLFRQKKFGDWEEVIKRIAVEVRNLLV